MNNVECAFKKLNLFGYSLPPSRKFLNTSIPEFFKRGLMTQILWNKRSQVNKTKKKLELEFIIHDKIHLPHLHI